MGRLGLAASSFLQTAKLAACAKRLGVRSWQGARTVISSIIVDLPPDIQPLPYPGKEVVASLPDSDILTGRSVQVLLGIRYHYDIGDWKLKAPPRWNTSLEAAKAEIWSLMGAETAEVTSEVIRPTDIALEPPINDTRDVVALLSIPKLRAHINTLRLTFNVTSFGLPGIGGRPLILYVAGSARVIVDRVASFQKTYVSPGGDVQLSDELVISSGGE